METTRKVSLVYQEEQREFDVLSKKLKKIAETEKWELVETAEIEGAFLEDKLSEDQRKIVMQLLSVKQQGYKSQDKKKELYCGSEFVSVENICDLLKASNLTCFYCELPVKLIYKYARDPKQWSLERVDNDYGHNRNNVVIACLDCNVRRRTIYQERYKKTKEMYNVVKLA